MFLGYLCLWLLYNYFVVISCLLCTGDHPLSKIVTASNSIKIHSSRSIINSIPLMTLRMIVLPTSNHSHNLISRNWMIWSKGKKFVKGICLQGVGTIAVCHRDSRSSQSGILKTSMIWRSAAQPGKITLSTGPAMNSNGGAILCTCTRALTCLTLSPTHMKKMTFLMKMSPYMKRNIARRVRIVGGKLD